MQRRIIGMCIASAFAGAEAHAQDRSAMPEIVVTGSREMQLRAEVPSSISVLDRDVIANVHAAHPSELLGRVPGVTIQQTNGEGHITGIRQPVGTAAVYLYLEDGVPVRASGFFNHNALYEVNLAQSGSVEVIRGPGTALYGSDAIGGIVNAITRAPTAMPEASLTLEGGSFKWLRALGSASNTWDRFGLRADVNITHSDGWRDTTGYDRQSVTLRADYELPDGHLKAVFAASNIDQATGANSALSRADYVNAPKTNYFPIAFRKVQSARGSLDWQREDGNTLYSVIPYFRWSTMDLLPTFMLGFDPVNYTTGYSSVGMLAKVRYDFEPFRSRFIAGIDLDYSPGSRQEDRIALTRNSSFVTGYTTTARIYDYDVTFWQAAPYAQLESSPLRSLRLTAGVRLDVLGYKYDNLLADGAFSTPTPFGPRTYFRPGDTSVDYTRATPSFGATYTVSDSLNVFASYKQSFRVPQESQLFRQGTNIDSVGLKPVIADSYEVGMRSAVGARLGWDISLYRMIKRDDILTLTTGAGPTQTNNGKTRHQGIEVALAWQVTDELRLSSAASLSDNAYTQWITSGAVDLSGRKMSAAPRTSATSTLEYAPAWAEGLRAELEWVHLGRYWMDDANTQQYGGHELFNLRASYRISDSIEVFGRVSNLLDRRWSTSSSISNGQPQYAPGLPLTVYGGVTIGFGT
ncbi:MAG: TonB-dependent receptor [Rhodospirillaceae bacterium]